MLINGLYKKLLQKKMRYYMSRNESKDITINSFCNSTAL